MVRTRGMLAGAVARGGAQLAGRVFGTARQYLKRKAPGAPRKRGSKKFRSSKLRGIARRLVGGSGTMSKYRTRIGKDKYMAKLSAKLGRQMYMNNSTVSLTSGPGVQATSDLCELFKGSEINTGTGVTANGKVFLSRGRIEIRLTNWSSAPVNVELYNIAARRDQVTGSSYVPPGAAWNIGEHYVSGGGAGSGNIIGCLPFDSPQFIDYFVVKKITRFVMGPGDVHVHTSNFKLQKYCRQDVNANTEYQRGLYNTVMGVFSGFPQDDTMAANNTLGSIKLGCVVSTRVCFESVSNNVPTVNLTNNLPTSFTNAEEDMEVTGIKQAHTNI
jgi:hypothetical protein